MNKKILPILALLIIFLTVSTAHAGIFDFLDGNNSNTHSNVTNDNSTFVIGVNLEFPPFEYRINNGEIGGFDIDVAKEVCRRNNWTFQTVQIINWDSKEVELNSGEIDCIWSAFTMNNRENDYTWSDPYFNNTQVLVVKSNSNISSIDDLKGKTVEIQMGSSGADVLKEQDKSIADTLKIQEVHDFNTAFMDLKSEGCDAVLVDVGLANYKIAENPNEFKVLDKPLSDEQYGIGFKKGNTELKDQVQKTLDEMFKDGTIDKIAANYSDYKIKEFLIYPK